MTYPSRQESMKRFNLTQEKVNQMVERALRACLDFSAGKLTMDQVWYRVRGDRFFFAVQVYPDDELGGMLYELAMNFLTDRESYPDVLRRSILEIADKLKSHGGLIH